MRSESTKEQLHSVSARVPINDYEQVKRIAKKRKMSEAQVIRMLLGVGIECHQDMERLGLIGIVDMVYYVKEAIKGQSAGKQLVLPMT